MSRYAAIVTTDSRKRRERMDFEVYLDEETGMYHLFKAGAPVPDSLAYVGTATVAFKAETQQYLKSMGDPDA
jgi:hypothetical protein